MEPAMSNRACLLLSLATGLFAAACDEEPLEAGSLLEAEVETAMLRPTLHDSLNSRLVSYFGGQCLGVEDGRTDRYAPTEWRTCDAGEFDQVWRFEPYYGPEGRTGRFRNVKSGMCLDTVLGLALYPCVDDQWQRWDPDHGGVWQGVDNAASGTTLYVQLEPAVSASYGFEIRAGSQCWDVPGLSHSNVWMQRYACNDGANQRFRFEKIGGTTNRFTLHPQHSGRCLQQVGDHVAQMGCSPSPLSSRQDWSIHYDWDLGYYHIQRAWHLDAGIAGDGRIDLDTSPHGSWSLE